MSKVMGIYVKFTRTTHQICSMMSRDPGFKFRKVLFSPNSVLNFRKSYKIWGKLAQEQKVTGKKAVGGGKHPPPPALIGLKRLKRGRYYLFATNNIKYLTNLLN